MYEIELRIDPEKKKYLYLILAVSLLGGGLILLGLGTFQRIIRFFRPVPKFPEIPKAVYDKIMSVLKKHNWVDPLPYGGMGGKFLLPFQLYQDRNNKLSTLAPDFAEKVRLLLKDLDDWCVQKWTGKIRPGIMYATRPLGIQAQIAYLGYTKTLASKHLIGRAVDIYPYSFGYKGYKGWINENSKYWNEIMLKQFCPKLDELAKKYGLVRIRWDRPHIEDKVDFITELERLGIPRNKFYEAKIDLCALPELRGKKACLT